MDDDFERLSDDEDMYPDADLLEDVAVDLCRWYREGVDLIGEAREVEAATTNLRLPLGRTMYDHVVIQMMVAAGRGVDPADVIEAFAREVVS